MKNIDVSRIVVGAVCLVIFVFACSCGRKGRGASSSRGAWLRLRGGIAEDPAVVRYYTFEDVGGDGAVANVAGWGGGMEFTGEGPAKMRVVRGRWNWKKAVRLDGGTLAAEPFEVGERGFGVEMWLRTHGKGAVPGPSIRNRGTLMAVGSGYRRGWRLTMNYPDGNLEFELGRREGPVGARTTDGVPDGVWHHVAATWDRERIRLYVDGVLRASVAYDGSYHPASETTKFRVGYVGNGLGSIFFEVGEVAVYGKAPGDGEVFRHAYFHTDAPQGAVERFVRANAAFGDGRYGAAAEMYEGIRGMPELHAHLVGLAELRMAAALERGGRRREAFDHFAEAAAEEAFSDTQRWTGATRLLELRRNGVGTSAPPALYERILSACETSVRAERSARLNMARAYRREGRYESAGRHFRRVLELSGLPFEDQLRTRLELAHTCLEMKDYEAARKHYGTMAEDADAPALHRAIARMQVAESHRREGNYDAARAECRRVEESEEFPRHLRWEARQRAQEIRRLQAGLGPRDPSTSRTKLPKLPKPGVEFYVAPDGDDDSAGTPQAPFATPGRARDAIRMLKRDEGLPRGGAAVILRGGEYRLEETFRLTAEDSGREDAPIVYRAAEGEVPRLNGGASIVGFRPVRRKDVLARLPQGARRGVLAVELRDCGIGDFGVLRPNGFGWPFHPVPELYFDGRPMRLARYPNDGYVRTGEVFEQGPNRSDGIIFRYEGERPDRWGEPDRAWLHGYWKNPWSDYYLAVESVDVRGGRIVAAHRPHFGVEPDAGYYYLNVLEELDSPGEWYIDRERGVLYFYAPSEPAAAAVEFPVVNGPLVRLDGASHVQLRGLTVEYGRSHGIVIEGGEESVVSASEIRRVAGTGVVVEGGKNHTVLGSDLHTLGWEGVKLEGGNRKTLVPAGHVVENCHVHHFGRVRGGETAGIRINGVGNRARHNLVHHGPAHGIRPAGNEHVIEYNEVHSVVLETDDQNGLDMYGLPTFRGNVVRYNYWHHIGSGRPWGQAGIRLDAGISGTVIYGNVFYRTAGGQFGAVHIHGGKDNIVDNNVFAHCRRALGFNTWGQRRWQAFLSGGRRRRDLKETARIDEPPYSTRYPELAHLREEAGLNHVWRNVVYNCGRFLDGDRGRQDVMDNYVTDRDPGFVDAQNGQFGLREDSPVFDRSAFRPIPFDEIGLYKSEHRASWPVEHEVVKDR